VRGAISDMLKNKVDSITDSRAGAKIIIAGDFNCVPDDAVIMRLTEDRNHTLVNLAEKPSAKGEGTYRFQGTWELIDQVLISEGFLKSTVGLKADRTSFRIFKPDFLLVNDPKFPGTRPFSTYAGYKYQGGISDHLPVLLDLFFR
jgi:endonuclease/exonuclease/phosphatase family metal-dependent hydrolase